MPSLFYSNRSSAFTPQPVILPQSEGDLEEARIRRATDLANLAKLQQEPRLALRQIALQKAGLDDTIAFHQGTLANDLRGQDISLRGQDLSYLTAARGDETVRRGQDLTRATEVRGQDINQQENAARNKTALLSQIFQLAADPNNKLDVVADAAKRAGVPEYADALQAGHQHEVQATAAQQLTGLVAAKTAGSPQDYQAILQTLDADPEVKAQILRTAPDYIKQDLGVKRTAPNVSGAPDYLRFQDDPEIQKLLPAIQQRQLEEVKQKAAAEAQKKLDERERARFNARRAAGVYPSGSYGSGVPFGF